MNTFSILLVEDDSIERLKFKKVLKKLNENYTITEAENGRCALRFLEDNKSSFNLIISDFNMPKMNGLEFLKEIKTKTQFKNIPFVMLTNTNDTDELKKCFDLGVSGCFTKPQNLSDYSKKIKTILKYWHTNMTFLAVN